MYDLPNWAILIIVIAFEASILYIVYGLRKSVKHSNRFFNKLGQFTSQLNDEQLDAIFARLGMLINIQVEIRNDPEIRRRHG